MSETTIDFEARLRSALDEASKIATQANDDLLRIASEASDAVSKVTDGAAMLELAPINEGEDRPPTYQLQLRRVDSEAPWTDLGVFRLSEVGYPVDRWASRSAWESNPDKPERQHNNIQDIRGNFDYLLSRPDSKLVLLLSYLRQLKAVR
jgi:hypothetical protein